MSWRISMDLKNPILAWFLIGKAVVAMDAICYTPTTFTLIALVFPIILKIRQVSHRQRNEARPYGTTCG